MPTTRKPASSPARFNELSEMARLGTFIREDAAQLDSYIHVSNLCNRYRRDCLSQRDWPVTANVLFMNDPEVLWRRSTPAADADQEFQ